MLKKINFVRLIIATLVLVIIAVVTYFVCFALDEGGLQNPSWAIQAIVFCIEWLFILIAYPAIYLNQASWVGMSGFFVIILIDCFVYAFLVEIAIIKYRHYNLKKLPESNLQ